MSCTHFVIKLQKLEKNMLDYCLPPFEEKRGDTDFGIPSFYKYLVRGTSSFMPILLKLYRCFCLGLKMCMFDFKKILRLFVTFFGLQLYQCLHVGNTFCAQLPLQLYTVLFHGHQSSSFIAYTSWITISVS